MYTDSYHSTRSDSITAGRGPDKSATGERTTTGGSNLLRADIIGRPGFSEADDGSSRNILVPTSSCAYLCKHNLGCLRNHAGACVWKKSMNIVLYITLRDTRCGHAHRARQVSERFGCVGVHGVRRSSEDQARVRDTARHERSNRNGPSRRRRRGGDGTGGRDAEADMIDTVWFGGGARETRTDAGISGSGAGRSAGGFRARA
jgi:hypothetical protein